MPVNITMEQVEKVRACTQCSYEEAKGALEETGGNVLDAVILLERREQKEQTGGDYSTRGGEAQEPAAPAEWKWPTWKQVWDVIKSLVENCLSICLEVWKGGEMTCRVPLLAAVLLLLVAPYVTVGLLLMGLCLGYRVHVSGRGTEGWGGKVNSVMDQIADTVHDAVSSLRGDRKQGRK